MHCWVQRRPTQRRPTQRRQLLLQQHHSSVWLRQARGSGGAAPSCGGLPRWRSSSCGARNCDRVAWVTSAASSHQCCVYIRRGMGVLLAGWWRLQPWLLVACRCACGVSRLACGANCTHCSHVALTPFQAHTHVALAAAAHPLLLSVAAVVFNASRVCSPGWVPPTRAGACLVWWPSDTCHCSSSYVLQQHMWRVGAPPSLPSPTNGPAADVTLYRL